MATYVITAGYVAIDGTDMSAYVKSASLELNADPVEFTNMASSGAREFKIGLKSGTLNVELNNDFANTATLPDQKIWGIFNTGANVTAAVRATSSAISNTNPEYQVTVVPVNYSPFTGSVGDAAVTSISWPTSGGCTRDITP
jgi:Flp pilus assembly protein TadG